MFLSCITHIPTNKTNMQDYNELNIPNDANKHLPNVFYDELSMCKEIKHVFVNAKRVSSCFCEMCAHHVQVQVCTCYDVQVHIRRQTKM